MLAETDHTAAGEHDQGEPGSSVPAPPGPLCGREEYEWFVARMVGDFAPRMFAVVQDYGDRVDWRIAAWGLAFDGYAEIVGADRRLRMSAGSPEDALIGFTDGPDVSARVLWVHRERSTDADMIDPA